MPTDEHSTPIAGQAVSAQTRETYPSIQELFSHTLAPEPFDAEDNYGGWESDQLGRPRFFLKGVKQLSSFLHTYEMKKYFELRDDAKALLMQRPGWTLVAPGILEPIAENQFNRAKNEDAITFERAVVIIAAFEVRYAHAIAAGHVSGTAYDVYERLKIVPACYHLENFNEAALKAIEAGHPQALQTLTLAAKHNDTRLITDLTTGRCVTKETAVLVKAALEELTGTSWNGRVCPNPGKFLGNKPTSTLEKIS
ncbi:RNA-binding protein [Rhizobium sp. B21/90]|uniref:RNA-binding protein n=1 Tax=Rhizobium sp. B21/90 TaxID=2819993 RepID=UPI001C5B9372|nr:RNA-binding protein [Rhizobium sp. B21/90]QYA04522.1 hypothetical protein J5278_20370 [Rhizobium sp. B21/90]